MSYQNFYHYNHYKGIFLGVCLGGVIYANAISPLIILDEEKGKIIKIPSEFSGIYFTNTTSSGSVSAIAFPLIPNFL